MCNLSFPIFIPPADILQKSFDSAPSLLLSFKRPPNSSASKLSTNRSLIVFEQIDTSHRVFQLNPGSISTLKPRIHLTPDNLYIRTGHFKGCTEYLLGISKLIFRR